MRLAKVALATRRARATALTSVVRGFVACYKVVLLLLTFYGVSCSRFRACSKPDRLEQNKGMDDAIFPSALGLGGAGIET